MTKFLTILVALALVSSVAIGVFYWFQYRPAQIKKSCLSEIKNKDDEPGEFFQNMEHINNYYRVCLVRHGLKPETLLIQ